MIDKNYYNNVYDELISKLPPSIDLPLKFNQPHPTGKLSDRRFYQVNGLFELFDELNDDRFDDREDEIIVRDMMIILHVSLIEAAKYVSRVNTGDIRRIVIINDTFLRVRDSLKTKKWRKDLKDVYKKNQIKFAEDFVSLYEINNYLSHPG